MRKSPPKANTAPENSVNPLMPLVVVELSTPATSMITATRSDHLAVAKRLPSMHHCVCMRLAPTYMCTTSSCSNQHKHCSSAQHQRPRFSCHANVALNAMCSPRCALTGPRSQLLHEPTFPPSSQTLPNNTGEHVRSMLELACKQCELLHAQLPNIRCIAECCLVCFRATSLNEFLDCQLAACCVSIWKI